MQTSPNSIEPALVHSKDSCSIFMSVETLSLTTDHSKGSSEPASRSAYISLTSTCSGLTLPDTILTTTA